MAFDIEQAKKAGVEAEKCGIHDASHYAYCKLCASISYLQAACAEIEQLRAELELRDRCDGICSKAACESVREEAKAARIVIDLMRKRLKQFYRAPYHSNIAASPIDNKGLIIVSDWEPEFKAIEAYDALLTKVPTSICR